MKYKNRIKRKQFERDAKWKIQRGVQATFISITKYLKGQQTFAEVIFKQIREGLDYGFGEIRYYMYSGQHYMASIEAEYNDYKMNPDDRVSCEKVFDLLVDEILPNLLSRYSDLELTTSEDEHGQYFEVRLLD